MVNDIKIKIDRVGGFLYWYEACGQYSAHVFEFKQSAHNYDYVPWSEPCMTCGRELPMEILVKNDDYSSAL